VVGKEPPPNKKKPGLVPFDRGYWGFISAFSKKNIPIFLVRFCLRKNNKNDIIIVALMPQTRLDKCAIQSFFLE